MESTKNIKWYTQNFKAEWLNDPEFNDWLEQDEKIKNTSYCKQRK